MSEEQAPDGASELLRFTPEQGDIIGCSGIELEQRLRQIAARYASTEWIADHLAEQASFIPEDTWITWFRSLSSDLQDVVERFPPNAVVIPAEGANPIFPAAGGAAIVRGYHPNGTLLLEPGPEPRVMAFVAHQDVTAVHTAGRCDSAWVRALR